MTTEPQTLGEKLGPTTLKKRNWIANATYLFVFNAVTLALAAAFLDEIQRFGQTVWMVMGAVFLVINVFLLLRRKQVRGRRNLLILNDRQGFMADLRLDAKTVVFDGSNIYHFGHDNEVDAQVLGTLAHQLREEGYRVVCFFDANIFYTLRDHGAFTTEQSHRIDLLQDIFGLGADEVYVVPSGVQADRYILETLRVLPISFAVTNDQFRDYAKAYPTVMKGDQWRKGVKISKNEVKLLKHRLKAPVLLS